MRKQRALPADRFPPPGDASRAFCPTTSRIRQVPSGATPGGGAAGPWGSAETVFDPFPRGPPPRGGSGAPVRRAIARTVRCRISRVKHLCHGPDGVRRPEPTWSAGGAGFDGCSSGVVPLRTGSGAGRRPSVTVEPRPTPRPVGTGSGTPRPWPCTRGPDAPTASEEAERRQCRRPPAPRSALGLSFGQGPCPDRRALRPPRRRVSTVLRRISTDGPKSLRGSALPFTCRHKSFSDAP